MVPRERIGRRKAALLAASLGFHGAVAAAGALAWPRPPPEPRILRVEFAPPRDRIDAPSPLHAMPVIGRWRGPPTAEAPRQPRPTRSASAPAPFPAPRPTRSAPAPFLPSGPGLELASVASGIATAGTVDFSGDAEAGDVQAGPEPPSTAAGVARPGGPDGEIAGAESEWLEANRGAIERRIQARMDMRPYPLQARRMWWTGDAEVAFVIARDGSVRKVRVLRSTGHEVLDRRAVDTILEAAPFPRPPVDQEVEIPFVFRLS